MLICFTFVQTRQVAKGGLFELLACVITSSIRHVHSKFFQARGTKECYFMTDNFLFKLKIGSSKSRKDVAAGSEKFL